MPEKAKFDRPSSGNAIGFRLSLAAKLYSIFALFAVLTAAITILSDYNTRRNAELTEAIETASRSALNVERVNSLVYAVVMESRGVYMSTEPAVVKKYGDGVIKFNDQILAVVKDWESIVRADDAELSPSSRNASSSSLTSARSWFAGESRLAAPRAASGATTMPIAACGPRSTRILKRFPGSMPNAARRSAGKPTPIARWHLS
jgi:hypothetical protein